MSFDVLNGLVGCNNTTKSNFLFINFSYFNRVYFKTGNVRILSPASYFGRKKGIFILENFFT